MSSGKDYIRIDLHVGKDGLNLRDAVIGGQKKWTDSSLSFAVFILGMCRATNQESAKELEEKGLAHVCTAGLLWTEGDTYTPGSTTTNNPFAAVHLLMLVGLKTGLDGNKYCLSMRFSRECQRFFKQIIPKTKNLKYWSAPSVDGPMADASADPPLELTNIFHDSTDIPSLMTNSALPTKKKEKRADTATTEVLGDISNYFKRGPATAPKKTPNAPTTKPATPVWQTPHCGSGDSSGRPGRPRSSRSLLR